MYCNYSQGKLCVTERLRGNIVLVTSSLMYLWKIESILTFVNTCLETFCRSDKDGLYRYQSYSH